MKKIIASFAVLACTSCCTPAPAELATYEALSPAYLRYVEADEALTEEQKVARRDLIESWRIRVGGEK